MTREKAIQLARALRTQIAVRKLLRDSGAMPPDDELARKAAAFAREIILVADAINMLDQVRNDHRSNRGLRRSVL
jgi:hypothetical protein